MDELEALNLLRGSEARTKAVKQFAELENALLNKLKGVLSPNNNDAAFWVKETYWQIAHNAEAEKYRNLERLHKVVDSTGHLIAPDQLEEFIHASCSESLGRRNRAVPRVALTRKRLNVPIFSPG